MSTQEQDRAEVVAANPYVALAHQPTDQDLWQESPFLLWYDRDQGIGGWQRFGHEPNLGLCNQWTGVFTRDGLRYRSCDNELRLRPGDRGDRGLGAAGTQFHHTRAGRPRWEVTQPDYQADLVLDDFYPMTAFFSLNPDNVRSWGDDQMSVDGFAPAHFEASSRVTGTVRLGDRNYTVDALGHRDHSFGYRDWGSIRGHRAFVGTFGPDLSFSAAVWHTADDQYRGYGMLHRDGREHWAEEVEIVVWMEADGLSHRGGELILHLPGGETVHLTGRTVDQMMFHHREYTGVESIIEVTCGDRTGGMADLEVSNNPRGGTLRNTLSIAASMEQGLADHRVGLTRFAGM